jgi:hypothetical protein
MKTIAERLTPLWGRTISDAVAPRKGARPNNLRLGHCSGMKLERARDVQGWSLVLGFSAEAATRSRPAA